SERYLARMPDPEAARGELLDAHPVGRLGAPSDIGDVAVFLAGDRSSFMTGEVLGVDGGRTVRLPPPRCEPTLVSGIRALGGPGSADLAAVHRCRTQPRKREAAGPPGEADPAGAGDRRPGEQRPDRVDDRSDRLVLGAPPDGPGHRPGRHERG